MVGRARRGGSLGNFSTVSTPPLSPPTVPCSLRHSSEAELNEGRRRSGLSSVAEECGIEREHGYKRIALPLRCCDVTTQTFPPSFPSKSY